MQDIFLFTVVAGEESRRLGNDKFIRLSAKHFLSELSGIGNKKNHLFYFYFLFFAGLMIDLMRLGREVEGEGYRDDDDGVSLSIFFCLMMADEAHCFKLAPKERASTDASTSGRALLCPSIGQPRPFNTHTHKLFSSLSLPTYQSTSALHYSV